VDADALASLRDAAIAATPGPWVVRTGEVLTLDDDPIHGLPTLIVSTDERADEAQAEADAAYIAAADPSTVLALIAELETLRAEVRHLRGEQ
jgi:hypothetical protein